MTKTAVLILAAGSGLRMGNSLPKQFLMLGGKPILMHTIERFAEALENCRIIVVLPESHTAYWHNLCREYGFDIRHEVCMGGGTRYDSVKNGLELVGDASIVAVHDSVRPFVSTTLIKHAVDDAETFGAVVPAIPVVDSLREINDHGNRRVDRAKFRIIQSPQIFKTHILKAAYQIPFDETFIDDASVVEANGTKIYLCKGEFSNIKITSPVDMFTAEAILHHQQNKK